MKLTAGRVSTFLDRPDHGFQAALIFGANAGLAREYADAVTRRLSADPNNPFSVTQLSAAEIAEDPARLYDEMNGMSLFGGGARGVIRIEDAGDALVKQCGDLLERLSPSSSGNYLVIVAGELESKSKLRQLAEESPAIAALACYAEEGAALAAAIRQILQAQNLSIGEDALALLQSLAPPDRALLRNEMEKLALYCHGQAEVRLADVRAVCSDVGVAEEFDLAWDIADGKAAQADRAIARLYDEGTAPVALLRLAQNHFSRLEAAAGRIADGASADEAMSSLRPPVFRMRQSQFQRQLGLWSCAKSAQAMQRLIQAEAACKKTGTPDKALAARTLLLLAQSASPLRSR